MTGHLIVTRGLPGAGKDTQVRLALEGYDNAVILSRDGFRAMLQPWVEGNLQNEDLVTKFQQDAVAEALSKGLVVAVCDTNLPQRRVREWLGLAERQNASWAVWDMTDVPLETCLERNARRERPVPESIIRNMHQRFIASGNAIPDHWVPLGAAEPTKGELYVPNTSKPLAVIVDIDGTVAKMDGRSPYDYSRVDEDKPNWTVIDYVESIAGSGVTAGGGPSGIPGIIFVSGRPESCRFATERWLMAHLNIHFTLFMRTDKEHEKGVKDYDVKLRIFNESIRDNYNVHSVIDDRTQVVRMWRSLGLTVLQVDEGNF